MAGPQLSWRRRMANLARRVGEAHPPLFAPLLRGIAAQIEAIDPREMIADPTRLTKGLGELKRALALDVLVTATPCGMEAEALGARVERTLSAVRVTAPASPDLADREDFTDAWAQSVALAAALETTRRLASTVGEETVIVAALTGPATLADELGGTAMIDVAARALTALTREFGQAGAGVVALVERAAPDAGWGEVVMPIANVAKFLKMPTLLAFSGVEAPGEWPPVVIPCPPAGLSVDGIHGLALDPAIATWAGIAPGAARAVITAGEVPADTPLAALVDAVALWQSQSSA